MFCRVMVCLVRFFRVWIGLFWCMKNMVWYLCILLCLVSSNGCVLLCMFSVMVVLEVFVIQFMWLWCRQLFMCCELLVIRMWFLVMFIFCMCGMMQFSRGCSCVQCDLGLLFICFSISMLDGFVDVGLIVRVMVRYSSFFCSSYCSIDMCYCFFEILKQCI